jgi:hypothetical protein
MTLRALVAGNIGTGTKCLRPSPGLASGPENVVAADARNQTQSPPLDWLTGDFMASAKIRPALTHELSGEQPALTQNYPHTRKGYQLTHGYSAVHF